MKTLKLIAAGIILFASSSMHSQVSVQVGLGSPPAWAPPAAPQVEYYYLPDVESYYDVRASRFIYYNGGTWIRSKNLPRQYRNYDLYKGYKVVLNDYHGHEPYTYFKNHKVKYYKGYKGGPKRTIGVRNNIHVDNGNHGNHGNNGKHGDNGNHGNKGNGNGKGKH